MTDAHLAAMVEQARTRSACKRLGAKLDADPRLKTALLHWARARGVDLPDDAVRWPGKRLLRRARGREQAARIRRNPIARDEAFRCVACGRDVPPHGRSARDHCPYCLTGLHVDRLTPGDRASSCGGQLRPTGVERRGGRWMIAYTCARCGARRTNQVLLDGDPPDDWGRVVALCEEPP